MPDKTTTPKSDHVEDWKGDADLLHPSQYLRYADLQGKEWTLTIARVEKEREIEAMLQGKYCKTKAPVIHFVETKKMLIMNKTNKNRIASWYSKACAKWAGQKITLYPADGLSKADVLKVGQRGVRVRGKDTKGDV